MSITTQSIYNRVLKRLSQVPGVNTQLYDGDQLLENIQHTFDMLFDKYWWFEYFEPGLERILDGTTGQVTVALPSDLRKFTDIRGIWFNTEGEQLPIAPTRFNPQNITRRVVQPTASGIFRILPVTEEGDLTIAYRKRPAVFTALDDTSANTILLDDQLMILGTAWDFMNSSGINPAEEDKLLGLFRDRTDTLLANQQSMAMVSGNVESIPMGWSEVTGEY